MGLLEHINSVYYSPKSQQEGLLSLAEKFRENNSAKEEIQNNIHTQEGLLSVAQKFREKQKHTGKAK